MTIISYKRCIICDSDSLLPFRRRGHFELVRCRECKLIFCNNIKLEEIQKFYSEQYFEQPSAEMEDNFSSYEKMGFIITYNARIILNQIEKFRKEPGKLLDVGTGFGHFLNEARLRRWEVFGIEPSNKGYLYAKEHFKIPLVQSLFEYDDTELERFQFDVITFLGVLDHSTAPHKMLAKAHSLLRSNGLVVSTALNIDWWLKIIDFRPPTHLFYFSEKNLSQLYQKLGFRILVNQPFWVPFSVDEFVWRVLTYYLRIPRLASFICPLLSKLFRNTIVGWPNENLIIAQKIG